MRIVIPVALLIITGCGSEMKEFSPDGTFTVLMAGTPKQDSLQTSLGSSKTYTVDERNGTYGIEVTDYPGDRPWTDKEIDERLKALRDEMLAGKARLTSEQTITLNERYPGRVIEAELSARDGLLRARFYVVKNRLYRLTAVGSKSWANSEDVNRFLGSLKVKE